MFAFALILTLILVLGAGLEPARPYEHRILSPACLPIPPPEHLFYKKRRARDGVRTRDLDLGKVALYQLSYFRVFFANFPSRLKGLQKYKK